jgi:hypothetical protein
MAVAEMHDCSIYDVVNAFAELGDDETANDIIEDMK